MRSHSTSFSGPIGKERLVQTLHPLAYCDEGRGRFPPRTTIKVIDTKQKLRVLRASSFPSDIFHLIFRCSFRSQAIKRVHENDRFPPRSNQLARNT
jgi:hypothetical protein